MFANFPIFVSLSFSLSFSHTHSLLLSLTHSSFFDTFPHLFSFSFSPVNLRVYYSWAQLFLDGKDCLLICLHSLLWEFDEEEEWWKESEWRRNLLWKENERLRKWLRRKWRRKRARKDKRNVDCLSFFLLLNFLFSSFLFLSSFPLSADTPPLHRFEWAIGLHELSHSIWSWCGSQSGKEWERFEKICYTNIMDRMNFVWFIDCYYFVGWGVANHAVFGENYQFSLSFNSQALYLSKSQILSHF